MKRQSSSSKRAEAAVAPALLAWYDRHARKLPWRVGPKERARGVRPDPYRVWLSEVMLQQTTVATVKSYYDRFIASWPTVEHLAAAPREDVLKAWAGLGYYARARNLKACAEAVVRDHSGSFPQTSAGLRALPGVGDYTSAAVAAIAFDEPVAVVDANIERVVSRLYAIDTPLPAAKKIIRERQAELTPDARAGDFAQAMMDLGATLCTPRKPACSLCPISDPCLARAAGTQEMYPLKAPKAERPTRRGAAFVAQHPDGSILLRTRPDTGLLGGMSEVPGSEWSGNHEPSISDAPFRADWRRIVTPVEHVFTHFRLELTVYHCVTSTNHTQLDGGWWSSPEALPDEALPTVMKKAIEAAVSGVTRRKKKGKTA